LLTTKNPILGDGLADYLVIWDGGSVDAYLNTGKLSGNSNPRYWEEKITIAPGVQGVPGSKIRFADIDGMLPRLLSLEINTHYDSGC
jgi:hypothetical protein